MSGVSASAPEPSVNTKVLLEILGSSESVQARVTQYQDAKAKAEEAFANLKIGTDAKAAYDDAQAKLAEAQAKLDDATKNADASLATVAEAQAKAKSLVDDAQAQIATAYTELTVKQDAHTAWVQSAKDDLALREADLANRTAAYDAAKATLDAELSSAQAAKTYYDDMAQRATDAEQKAKDIAAKLNAAMQNLTGAPSVGGQ